jgi:hypothetical protein
MMNGNKKKRTMYMDGKMVRKPMMEGGKPRQGASGTQPVYGSTIADAMPAGSAN